MIVRKLRLQRGWSQSQLAEMAHGVTTRTKALLCLSGPFPFSNRMNTEALKADEQQALLYARRMKETLISYGVLAAVFLVFRGEAMVYILFAGLGVALLIQFLMSHWSVMERRLVERKLGRKL
jgi:hypothetical protein